MRRCRRRGKGFQRSGFVPILSERRPDRSKRSILLAALKACGVAREIERGRLIHGENERDEADLSVANALVSMYAKCGCLADAWRVFGRIPAHDVVSWNALALGCADNDEEDLALELVEKMKEEAAPNARSFLAAVKACISLAEKEQGKIVDGKVVKLKSLEKGRFVHSGAVIDMYVANSLVDMYAKCGSMANSRRVFDRMPCHNTVSWTSLMLGYSDNGEGGAALELFEQVIVLDDALTGTDAAIFVAALKACTSLAMKEMAREVDGSFLKTFALEKGIFVHAQVSKSGWDRDIAVASTLVNMYAKCGSMAKACMVFNSMSRHDIVSWTALIIGYGENGSGDLALRVFDQMQSQETEAGVQIDGKMVKLQALEKGMAVHLQAKRRGCDSNSYVSNSLLAMYVKCRSMLDARRVFDRRLCPDVVSWNALMTGYVENGDMELVLELFTGMQQRAFTPDALTLVCVLKACIGLTGKESNDLQLDKKLYKVASLERSMFFHSQAVNSGLDTNSFVAGTLVELYARCGSTIDARSVFDRLSRHDVVLLTALIFGYAENGEGDLALALFASMRGNGLLPDAQTFVAALKACGNSAAMAPAKAIHAEKCRCGLVNDAFLETSLLDAYGKCGSTIDAQRLFDTLPRLDSPTWTTLIAVYSRQGDSSRVIELFHSMQREGFQADEITFVSLLSACSHAGLVEAGKKYFELMLPRYRVKPTMDHYICMIDIYGRANKLETAVEMIRNMPFEANVVTWRTLLAACTKRNNLLVAKLAFDALVRLDEASAAAYSLMGSIYGNSGSHNSAHNTS